MSLKRTLSLPMRERELKRRIAAETGVTESSLPMRERELKLFGLGVLVGGRGSLPMRERELKRVSRIRGVDLLLVAPHAGA